MNQFSDWVREQVKFVKHESNDNVNHPTHYTKGNIECIEAMQSAFGKEEVMTFCKLNAFKYLWRAENKNGEEDIEKAHWYLSKYIELSKKQ